MLHTPPLPFAFLFSAPLTALLIAAGAAAAPIVIHLLNRNRYRVVTWAAMRFLLGAQRKNTRRMRLEQMILLAVRTLIMLLLVAAMASVMPWADAFWQRVFPHSGGAASVIGRRTHKVLVLDGSFSMAAQAGDSSCFDKARAAAVQLCRESSSGDGFSVILMAAPARRVVPGPSDDAGKVADEIQALRLPHGNADLASTLHAVEDILRQSPAKFEEKEVYFFTDLQRSTWTARQSVNPAPMLQKIQSRARTVFVDVGEDGLSNLAVTGLTLAEPMATTTGNTSFRVAIHNYGNEPRTNVRVQLLVGRARVLATDPPFELRPLGGEKFVNVAAGQDAEPLTFVYRFPAPGEYAVQVRAEHDALDLDNVRTAVVTVKDSVPVMLVNGKPSSDLYGQATEWLRDALNPFPTGQVPFGLPCRPKVVSIADFDDAGLGDLAPYDCVFLCDLKQLTEAETRRLEMHLRSGGGVVFSLGPQVDLELYNRVLYRGGKGVLPARLIGRQEAPEKQTFTLYADEVNFQRPPLEAFAGDKDRLALLAARFRQYIRSEPAPRSPVRKILAFMPDTSGMDRATTRAPLPVNDPALLEWTRYRGRVLLMTSTLNMDWTSWPISPSYLPMMQELLRYAVAGRLREQAVTVGDPLEEYLNVGSRGLDVAIHTPDGKAPESTRIQDRDDARVLSWSDTDISGLYRATIGNDPREHLFAVNVPTSTEADRATESNLTRTNKDELKATYPGWDFQVVRALDEVSHVGGPAADDGAEPVAHGAGAVVARWLLLILLGLAMAEVVLAWRFGHYSAVHGAMPPSKAWWGRLLIGLSYLLILVVLAGAAVLVQGAWAGDFLGFLPEGFRRSVETGLGIPPPAPGEGTRWRLEFLPYLMDALTDPWLAGALGIAAAVLVVMVYLREGRTTRPGFKILLAALRICLVLVVLAVLLPQLRLWFERQGWPDVAIILDDSQSMSTVDAYRDPAVAARAKQLEQVAGLDSADRLQLAEALLTGGKSDWIHSLLTRQQVKVHVYHCSGRAARIADVTDPNDAQAIADARRKIGVLKAEGGSSQLGTAVRQVLNDFRGSSLSAVIMCTDGVTTEGEDLAKVARYAAQVGVPLFFVGIGDQHEPRDLRLHDLQVDDSVYVNDRLIFEVRLTGQGYTDLTVPLTLREKGKDLILDQKMVHVDPNGKPVKVRLVHRPTEPGEKTYVISVPVQPDEVQSDNNTVTRNVFVREAKLIKVLYVEGYARYEYRFLKALLERESAQDPRNKSIDLKVLLLDASDDYAHEDKSAIVEFPSKVELNQFDVLMMGDVDPADPRIAPHLKDLADFVRERGGGLLMLAGERDNPYSYRKTALADILPIEILRSDAPVDLERTEFYRPQLTALGRFHPIFRFEPDEARNNQAWEHLAELYWWAGGYRAKWGAEILAVHPQARAEASASAPGAGGPTPSAGGLYPLIVQQFVGAGRTMFFGIDETWRWRFREDELRYNQFWIQTVRYLSRNRQGRVRVFLDRQTPYRRGEPIKITVRFPDDAPAPDPKTAVKVVAERARRLPGGQTENETQTLRLGKVEGSDRTFEATMTRTPEGEYRFWLSAPTVATGRPTAEARVLAPPGEMEVLRMNEAEMQRAAEKAQGHFYTLADADHLLRDLPAGTRLTLNAPQPPTLLWNHGALFALAMLLLCTEWCLRKWRHLL